MPTKWTPKPKPTPPPIPTGGGLGTKVAGTLANGFTQLLNTVTDWFEDRLISFTLRVFEHLEAEIAPIIRPMIDELESAGNVPPQLRTLLDQLKNPSGQGLGGAILGFAMSGAQMGIGQVLSAWTAGLGYDANRRWRPNRLDPQVALAAMKRGGSLGVLGAGELLDHGFTDERISALGDLTRAWPQGGDLLELVRRDPAYEVEAKRFLTWSGMTAPDADRVLSLRNLLLDAATLRQLYVRREITEVEHDSRMALLGLTPDTITLVKRLYFPIPGPQDLIAMAVKEAFSEEQAAILGLDAEFPADFAYWGDRSGLAEYWAKKYWRAHWQLPSPQMGYEMLHRGVIGDGELDALIKALDYTPYWRGKLKAISYNSYTRVDIRRMYQTGILRVEQVLKAYKDIGYDDEHAENLTLFTVTGASTAEKDLTKADILGGYRDGLLSRAEAGEQLQGMGYDGSEAGFYLARADLDLAKEQQGEAVEVIHQRYVQHIIIVTQARNEMYSLGLAGLEIERLLAKWFRELQAAVKSLSRADIEQMYQIGISSHAVALASLSEIGYPSSTAGQILTLLDTQTQKEREEAAARGVRYATSGELAKLITQGLISEARAGDLLAARGYNGETVQWYLSSWRLDRERQAQAEEAAAERRAQAAVRRQTVSEVRQLWDQDIIDSERARALLAELHYLPAVVNQTLALWATLRQQAEAREAAARQRATEVRPRLLSVAQLHELYLSTVIDLAAAGAGLTALQYTADDAARLLVQWQLDFTEATERAELAALAAEERRTRLLSRSQVGELYLASVITQERAEALLFGLRYSPSDVRDTFALWDMRLAEMAAREAQTGTAEPERKVKTLSRSDVGKLYSESIISEAETRAALTNLGYFAVDVDNTLRLWTLGIQDAVSAQAEREQREAEAATRQLTRAQLEQMYGLDVLAQEELIAGYRQLGYTEEDISKMLAVIVAKRGGT